MGHSRDGLGDGNGEGHLVMSLSGEYLGMPVLIDDLDKDNQTFYRYCGQNELRVQECLDCRLKRLPPTSACPFCASERMEWRQVGGRGTVYSYGEVHHAIQGAFRSHLPYHLLLVELDEQKDIPNPYDGLRLQGNLAELDGSFRDDSGLEHLPAEGIASTLLFDLKGGNLITRTGHNVRSLSGDAEDRGEQYQKEKIFHFSELNAI